MFSVSRLRSRNWFKTPITPFSKQEKKKKKGRERKREKTSFISSLERDTTSTNRHGFMSTLIFYENINLKGCHNVERCNLSIYLSCKGDSFRQSVWKTFIGTCFWETCFYGMQSLHCGLKWKLLICRFVEFSFRNFNLCFNILFWILFEFLQRWQHFVGLTHFNFVEQFITILLEGL